MATVSTTEIAGGTAFPFLGGRVWTPLNTTAVGAEDLTVTGSLTAENCELVVRRILNNTGTLDITNCVLDISFNGNSPAISGTWNMEDVLITSNGTAYRAWGNWAGGAAVADYDWSNIVFACRVDTDGYLSYNSPFVPKLSATSTFANVSFVYRDRDGGSVGGVTPQLGGNQVWADASFGGFGLQLNTRTAGTDNATDHVPTRVLLRISNQGNANDGSTFANTQGWFINPDLRAFEAIDDTSLNCFILMDSSANSLWINPLMGQPTNSQFYGYVVAPAGGGPTWRMATVTNPSFTDTSSVFTIPSDNVSEAFQVPATLANNGQVADGAASNFNAQSIANPTNGFGFITYAPTQPTALNDLSGWRYGQAVTDATRSRAIENVAERTYRHYSWLQQGTDEEFGEARTISVPPFNATDAEIQTARDGGFDQLTVTGTTTGWATETDINTLEDPWVAVVSSVNASGQTVAEWIASDVANTAENFVGVIDTPTLADVEYGVTGTGVIATERNGDDVAVMSKLIAWHSLEGGGINAANDKIDLPHWSFGSALRFSTGLTFTSAASFPVASNPTGQTLTGLTFPATNITTTDQVTAIESTGNISLGGTFGSGALANKIPLNSIGGSINASGEAYRDLTLTGDSLSFTFEDDDGDDVVAIRDCSIITTVGADLGAGTFTDSTLTGGSSAVTDTGSAVRSNLTGGSFTEVGDLTDSTITSEGTVGFRTAPVTLEDSTVTSVGVMRLPSSASTYTGNVVLTATSFNNTPTTLTNITLNGTGAVDGTVAHTFTDVTFGGAWNFTTTSNNIVHTFDGVVFEADPTRTVALGPVLFQLGEGDTVASTFPESGAVPAGFQQVFPDLVVTVRNSSTVSVFYRVFNENDVKQTESQHFGSLGVGSSATVSIPFADIGANTWSVKMTGTGILDFTEDIIFSEGNKTTGTIIADGNYNTEGTDLGLSVNTTDTTDNQFVFDMITGLDTAGDGPNRSIGALKNTQAYCDWFGTTGLSITFPSLAQTRLAYNSATERAAIRVILGSGIDGPKLGGMSYRNEDGDPVPNTGGTAVDFNEDVVIPLPFEGTIRGVLTNIDIGVVDKATTEIDNDVFQGRVSLALIEYGAATGTNVSESETSITDRVRDSEETITAQLGTSTTDIKADTETILDRTQIIIED